MSENKLLVLEQEGRVLTLLMSNRRLIAGSAYKKETFDHSEVIQVGNIYIGKVQNIVKNINSAFVGIGNGVLCYLSLTDIGIPFLTNGRSFDGRLKVGDELLVQISREALKTKQPAVTTNVSLSGHYLAIATGSPILGFSKKLKKEQRKSLMHVLKQASLINGGKICRSLSGGVHFPEGLPYGMIIRTNAGTLHDDYSPLLEEWDALVAQYSDLLQIAMYRPCFTCLHKNPLSYLNRLKDFYRKEYDEIVTDVPEIYEEITSHLKATMPSEKIPVRLYQDDTFPLHKLYGIEQRLNEALNKRVWLKSGGYLIIEPTEALTVIDVNSGKYDAKHSTLQETFRKINLEATEEIARQIRLRNLSGIILIDYINMDAEDSKQELMTTLRTLAKKDPVHLNVIDITALGLVEMTRKKINKPLKEQLQE